MKPTLFLTATALCLGSSAAFTNIRTDAGPSTRLSMAKPDRDDAGKTFAASSLAAAYLLASVLTAESALAMDSPTAPSFADSSSVMVAGRSGGRAGGRSGGRAMPRAMPRSSTTKVYNTRTVIQAPPVVMGGGYGYGGYGGGYGYGGGLGLNLGLMGINSIGNGMREGRQNEMIATERAELGASKEREAELAMRVRQLEMMQMQQAGGGAGQAQPQIIIAPPQGQPQMQQQAPQAVPAQ